MPWILWRNISIWSIYFPQLFFNKVKGIDNSYSAGPVAYTPITSETYYVVEMNDLLVGGTSIGEL